MKRRGSRKNKKGQALLEYLVIVGVVSLGMLSVGVKVKSSLDDYFDKISQKMIDCGCETD